MKPLRYAALARVSSREQEQEGYSLQVQVAAFEEYARETEGDLVRVISAPESAKASSARALFGELIAFAKDPKNRVNKLLFHRVDRLEVAQGGRRGLPIRVCKPEGISASTRRREAQQSKAAYLQKGGSA